MMIQRVVSAMVLVVSAGLAVAQDGVESALCRESVVNELETGRTVDDLLVDGSVLYELSDDVLRVYGLSDPTEPMLARTHELGFRSASLWVNNGRLYVAGRSTVRVFDASDAMNLIELNTLEFEYTDAASYRFVGDRVFLVGDFLGLLSFDFTDVMNPVRTEVAAQSPGSGPSVVELVGSTLLYGLSFDNQLYDISDPASIDLIDDFGLFVDSRQSASAGSYLFVAGTDEQTLESGFLVYEVSDPLSPVLVSSLPIDADSVEYFEHDHLVLLKRPHAVEIVDVSDPLEPAWVGSYGSDAFRYDQSAMYDRYLYTTPWHGMQVIDTGLMGVSWLGGGATLSSPVDVEVEGEYAYVLDAFRDGQGWSGLNTFDVSEPGSAVHLDNELVTGFSRRLALRWPYVYTASLYTGLAILDVSDPSDIRTRSTINLADQYNGETIDVCVSDGFVYVANTHRLVVLDVADPDSPVIVDELEVSAECVHADGGYLFVTTSDQELLLYGLSAPGAPKFIDAIAVEGVQLGADNTFPRDMALDGDRLYIPSRYAGVLEFAVDAQDGLSFVRTHDLRSPEMSLRIEDGILYSTVSGVGQAHRIEGNGDLSYLGAFSSSSTIGRFALREGLAYVTGSVFGLDQTGVSVLDLQSQCTTCLADLNGDGVLDYFDAAVLMAAYQAGDASADLNGDGSIDFHDVSAFLDSYGAGCP
jgi:hypothetical protein